LAFHSQAVIPDLPGPDLNTGDMPVGIESHMERIILKTSSLDLTHPEFVNQKTGVLFKTLIERSRPSLSKSWFLQRDMVALTRYTSGATCA